MIKLYSSSSSYSAHSILFQLLLIRLLLLLRLHKLLPFCSLSALILRYDCTLSLTDRNNNGVSTILVYRNCFPLGYVFKHLRLLDFVADWFAQFELNRDVFKVSHFSLNSNLLNIKLYSSSSATPPTQFYLNSCSSTNFYPFVLFPFLVPRLHT